MQAMSTLNAQNCPGLDREAAISPEWASAGADALFRAVVETAGIVG